MKQLILDYTPYCTRAALVDDGELIDFAVERAAVRGIVGNIYKGKVENVLGGMKAAFVNIGLERNGFLYVGDSLVDSKQLQNVMPKKGLNVSAGDVIMCQVVKEQFGQKGARLTTDISIPGYYLVYLPVSGFIGVSRKIDNPERREYLEDLVKAVCPQNTGFIIRSAADKASDDDIINEAQELFERWTRVKNDYRQAQEKSIIFEEASLFERAIRDTFSEDVDKVIVNDALVASKLDGKVGNAAIEMYAGERNIMSHFNLSTQINHLCDHRVQMENGAYIVIDKTEALTVIDVNTGRYVGDKNLEDTVFKTNLAAAECIAKQLRLRNISGIVVIDFIDMQSEEHRLAVVDALKEHLKHDRMKTSAVSMTELGLVQLTRKKTRLPIEDFMLQPCEDCDGGFVISDIQLTFMLRDELVDFMISRKCDEAYVGLHPKIFETVFESNIMMRQITSAWSKKKIYLYADDTIRREKFVMSETRPDELPAVVRLLTRQSKDE